MTETLFLRDDIQSLCAGQDVFEFMQQLDGDIFRHKEGRRTLRFEYAGQSYFLKYHQGIGWGEIVKNWLQGRAPIVSARNEWLAIQRLHQLGIHTMTLAAYGERGWNPARRLSFVVTEDLTDTMSLEYLGEQWQQRPPSRESKLTLIDKLATISREMHQAGLNHRDYYLCHFLLDKRFAQTNRIEAHTRLFLIDLHRTQQRRKVPQRWLVKDLASLYFSAYTVPLTQRDKLRFVALYSGMPWRQALKIHANFWERVQKRADKLWAKWQQQYDP